MPLALDGSAPAYASAAVCGRLSDSADTIAAVCEPGYHSGCIRPTGRSVYGVTEQRVHPRSRRMDSKTRTPNDERTRKRRERILDAAFHVFSRTWLPRRRRG